MLGTEHVATDALLTQRPATSDQGAWEVIAVPVGSTGVVVGWMAIREFRDRARIQLGMTGGRMLANALRRAVEYEDVRERSELDPLTRVLNRSALLRRVDALIASGARFAVAVLDLDGFKQWNDTHGHAVGDQILVAMTEHLSQHLRTCAPAHLRTSDLVARVGGDEFVAVLPGLSAEQAGRILTRIPRSVRVQAGEVRFSCGVAGWPAHGTDFATALAHADAAMYRAKRGEVRIQPLPAPEDDISSSPS